MKTRAVAISLSLIAAMMPLNGARASDSTLAAGAGQAMTRPVPAWDSVGSASAPKIKAVMPARAGRVAVAGDGLQARKADMVRRMFWIMLAHR